MADFPVVSRETLMPVITPVIPLNFVYPGLSRSQIFSILWDYRKLSLTIIIFVFLLTALTVALWPRTYTATATLMVNYEVNDPLNGRELPLGQVGSYIATQVELMQTPEVLLAVVDRLHLTQNRNYSRGYRGDSGTLREWVAKKISKNLAIFQGQLGSQLIYVTYSANNPTEAAHVANAVVDVYKEQDYKRSIGPPGERAQHYAQQLDELKKKVENAQGQVTAFHQKNDLIDAGDKANIDVALLASLKQRLLEAQNARRVAEARASGNQNFNHQVLSSSLVQSLKSELATQQSRLAELTSAYTPQYPDVLALQAKIEATRRSLASALRSYSVNATADLSTARRLEQNLTLAVAKQQTKILAEDQLQGEGAKYLLELESAQTVYKRALEGYDQILFSSAGHDTNVSFISRATPPVKASKPRILTGLFLGFIAAILLGLGIPLANELLNRRVRCPDDLERHHGIPVLVEFGTQPVRNTV